MRDTTPFAPVSTARPRALPEAMVTALPPEPTSTSAPAVIAPPHRTGTTEPLPRMTGTRAPEAASYAATPNDSPAAVAGATLMSPVLVSRVAEISTNVQPVTAAVVRQVMSAPGRNSGVHSLATCLILPFRGYELLCFSIADLWDGDSHASG